ncbi:MAG TPA: aminotransferase class I/II-fold pyridoxal phosphate-dependent enzyme [Vicinamibacteria bacterium]
MVETAPAVLDLASLARDPGSNPQDRISRMAQGLEGSAILRIANEIRAMTASGRTVCDLTLGDFSPEQFRVPPRLSEAIQDAIAAGQTNYPPTNGLVELRQVVRDFYARELHLDYPLESVLIASGARPLAYALYRAVCDPGDRVVYTVPSWNNHHYAHMVGAQSVALEVRPEDRFMPTRTQLAAALPGARIVCLNSPHNPSGTAISRETLTAICEAIVVENEGRERRGERPLYLLYDQIYWMLSFGGAVHFTPPGLVPEMARYTLLMDGISKAFAATGLRVGFGFGPVDVIARMAAILGHVGAWAPRPEQVGTIALLRDETALREHRESFRLAVGTRLDRLHRGLTELEGQGLPVKSLPPMGAIYLTARFDVRGKVTPAGDVLGSNEDVRRYLLDAAAFGIVPFEAFGARTQEGWFRLSVGAVGLPEIDAAMPRVAKALRALS